MVTVLMMSAKMATLSLLKIRVFWNKGYDVISSAHDVTNRFLSHHSSCIIDVVMWLKFGNLSICQKSWEPSFWEVMDSFVLLAYASLAASRTLLQRLLACLNFPLESRFILLVQMKRVISINHGDEWGLTWYFLWGIYTSIPAWTHSQNSLAAAEAVSLKISSHGPFLKSSWRPS